MGYLQRKCSTKYVCKNSNRKDHIWLKEKTATIYSILFPLIFPVTLINLGTNKNVVLGKTQNPSSSYMFSAAYSGYYKLMSIQLNSLFLHTSYYLLTYSMGQSPSWEANWFAASQEIPRISQNPKVHYRTHKRPPPAPILGQPNPVHIQPPGGPS